MGELVSRLSTEMSSLVRGELELARLELTEKAKHTGKGAGAIGAAGLVALYGVGALIAGRSSPCSGRSRSPRGPR